MSRWLCTVPILLPLALGLGPTPAAARAPATEEFKLVLSPEPGQSPPGRICFASRNRQMRALRPTAPYLSSLGDHAVCDTGGCRVARRAAPARCSRCPEATHPDCRALLDGGEWALGDYTVVCADDAAAPVDGGTLYVAVESIEAENPPEIHVLEVAGGRVRWSPIGGTQRPSYRVLGGDFESSRLSHPRRPSDRPWAEMPVHRRCRCLDVQVPVGVDAVDAVSIDGAAVCRGVVEPGSRLPIEVPATPRGQVRGVRIEARSARLELAWGDRWPSTPLLPITHRMRFTWAVPCAWPAPDACPAAAIRGARCTAAGPSDGACHYDCTALAASALTAPVDVTFDHDTPPVMWSDVVGAAGERLSSDVPGSERVVWADVTAWRTDVPGDRIGTLRVDDPDGATRALPVPSGAGRVWVPAPGARCGLSLRVTPEGERDYLTRYASIGPGGRLMLDAPDEQVVPWDVQAAFSVGAGGVAFPDHGGVEVASQFTVLGELGLRLRAPGQAWFGDVRSIGGVVSAWPYGALGTDGDGTDVRTAALALLGLEVTPGVSLAMQRGVMHLFAGGGLAMALAVDRGHVDRLPDQAWLGSAVVGGQWPIRADMGSRIHLRATLRYIFGAHVRRFSTTFRNPSVERTDRAEIILLSGGLDFGF